MPSFSWEWLIVVAVLLMLFGAKRLPEMGRSLGRGMREFKEAVTGGDDEPAAKIEPPPEVPVRTTAPAPAPTETQSETESERVSNSS
jgi:sec-independent protein translocase protein TatA